MNITARKNVSVYGWSPFGVEVPLQWKNQHLWNHERIYDHCSFLLIMRWQLQKVFLMWQLRWKLSCIYHLAIYFKLLYLLYILYIRYIFYIFNMYFIYSLYILYFLLSQYSSGVWLVNLTLFHVTGRCQSSVSTSVEESRHQWRWLPAVPVERRNVS